ncbi:MAG TPA: isopentenyl phosphate kinase [Anaerolineaceae bacterium]|nr:isopentenyl phosphate kinase [Anaerolineaceae bacterium]HQH84465.1 isopentenyl phosphate kinase [Anaerolineaceae bacterium]
MKELVFLKLGGSLITDKAHPNTLRRGTLPRLAREIAVVCRQNPDIQIIIGHGSGSFGHHAAKNHKTMDGVRTGEAWQGFAEVWLAARTLNQKVVEALTKAQLPVITFPGSAGITANQREIVSWDIGPLQAALDAGLIPVVAGDVIFDQAMGGTILSTEDQFYYLAQKLHPDRILIAGVEPGVWADYPDCTRIMDLITPQTHPALTAALQGSASADVTGGMASKVERMIQLVTEEPYVKICIFSGLQKGLIEQALAGNLPGTLIFNPSGGPDDFQP